MTCLIETVFDQTVSKIQSNQLNFVLDFTMRVKKMVQETRKAFDTLKQGLFQRGFDHFSLLLSLEKEMEKNLDKNMTQSALDRFFNLVPKQ